MRTGRQEAIACARSRAGAPCEGGSLGGRTRAVRRAAACRPLPGPCFFVVYERRNRTVCRVRKDFFPSRVRHNTLLVCCGHAFCGRGGCPACHRQRHAGRAVPRARTATRLLCHPCTRNRDVRDESSHSSQGRHDDGASPVTTTPSALRQTRPSPPRCAPLRLLRQLCLPLRAVWALTSSELPWAVPDGPT